MDSIVIASRFNGPPDSGNGGYTAGLIAKALGGGPAEVTLRAPAPLERELAIAHDDGRVRLLDGETVVAEARRIDELHATPPPPVTPAEAAAAEPKGPFFDAGRPFRRCFVCGPDRDEGDGLRIFAAPVEGKNVDGRPVFAAVWTPPESLAGPDGPLPEELVWAALDCPTSGPVANDPSQPGYRPIVLGRYAARVDREVIPGETYVVLSWPLAVDGRKREAAAALFTVGGELCALSRALWIELR